MYDVPNSLSYRCFHFLQVYIGGDVTGRLLLDDSAKDLSSEIWIMHPGATMQPYCGSQTDVLHFYGRLEKVNPKFMLLKFKIVLWTRQRLPCYLTCSLCIFTLLSQKIQILVSNHTVVSECSHFNF